MDETEDQSETVDVDLLIEKHRNGPTGVVQLRFNAQNVTFTEPDNFYGDEEIPAEEAVAVAA